MANERVNSAPRLREHLDGDYDGDFLGGVMANVDYIRAREQSVTEQPAEQSEVEFIVADEHAANALHTIGADNIRGAAITLAEELNPGKDNLRGKA